MRREELLHAVEDVRMALLESKLGDALTRLLLAGADDAVYRSRIPEALEGLKRYTLSAQRYGAASRGLTRILALDELESTGMWLELLSPGTAPERLRELYQKIRLVEEVLPSVVGLLQPESLRELLERTDDSQPVLRGKSLLSVVVVEQERHFSTPRRMVDVLEAVSRLYSSCAELEGVSAETLSVAAMDSGQDKSFDFVGVGRVVEMVREIILSLWERVVLYRELPPAARLQELAARLPIVERIGELGEKGKIEARVAELLRDQITEAACRFVRAGAIIPEIEHRIQSSAVSPRDILASNLRGRGKGEEEFPGRDNLMRLLDRARVEPAGERRKEGG